MDYKDAWDKQQSSSGSGKPYSPQDYPLYDPNDADAGPLNSQWENYIFGDWADNSGGSSSSGGGYGGGYGNAYQKQLDAIRKQQQAEEQRLRDQTANLIRQYEAQKPVLRQRFTDNAQDAYVQKMNTLKEMPQVLSAQGYNGGLSESSNIKVDNQYGNAYNGHQRDYNEGLADVDNQIANTNASLNDALSQNSTHYGGMLMNAEMSYQQMLMQAQQEAQAQKLQEQVRQQEQDKWQKQFDYQKEQDKIANELARQKFTAANAKSSRSTAQSNSEKEEKAQIAAALKNAATQNFIDSIEHNMPKNNVYDKRTNTNITPDNQIEMALEMAIREGKLTQIQAMAIAQKYGLTDIR